MCGWRQQLNLFMLHIHGYGPLSNLPKCGRNSVFHSLLYQHHSLGDCVVVCKRNDVLVAKATIQCHSFGALPAAWDSTEAKGDPTLNSAFHSLLYQQDSLGDSAVVCKRDDVLVAKATIQCHCFGALPAAWDSTEAKGHPTLNGGGKHFCFLIIPSILLYTILARCG